jgi:hypothetical protein
LKLSELKTRLHIDKDDLDTELVEHPELFYQVASAYVEAVSDRDAKKESMKQLDARIASEVRAALEEEKGKTTEAAVTQGVLNSKEFQEAREEFMDLCRETLELEVLKESFHARGFVLNNLTQLTISRMAHEGMKSSRSDDAPVRRSRPKMPA